MEDPYEHEDPMMGYAPCNVPGRGCDPAAFDDCFAEGCACEDNCARWSGRNIKICGARNPYWYCVFNFKAENSES